MTLFKTQHGVAFGFEYNPHGILRLLHSYNYYGLYPVDIKIDAPDVNTSDIYVPGMDGKIDTTETLDGLVHYKNRKAEFKLKQIDSRDTWIQTYHRLLHDLHGKKHKIILDDDGYGYYVGRFTVEKPKTKKIGNAEVAYFTVKGDLEPYKYDLWTTGEPWKWAPFRFTRDSIRRPYYRLPIKGTAAQTITIRASDKPAVPNITIARNASQLPDASTDVKGVNISYRSIYATVPGNDKTKLVQRTDYNTTALFGDLILCELRQKYVTLTVQLVAADGYTLGNDSFAYLKIDYTTGQL